MNEMVERVARAIWNAREDAFPSRIEREPFDELNPLGAPRAFTMIMARAAIAVMREPTEEMLQCGADAECCEFIAGQDGARECWELMVDEALK